MHKLLQGHREQRDRQAEAANRVEETDEVDVIERLHGRVPEGTLETTTCATVQVARLTCASWRRDAARPRDRRRVRRRRHGLVLHIVVQLGRRRGRRRMCPTAAAGGIGAIRDRTKLTSARWRLVGAEAVLKLPLRASRDLDARWHSHEARSTGASHAQRCAERVVLPDSTPPRHPSHTPSTDQIPLPSAAPRSPQRLPEVPEATVRRRRRRAAPICVSVLQTLRTEARSICWRAASGTAFPGVTPISLSLSPNPRPQ